MTKTFPIFSEPLPLNNLLQIIVYVYILTGTSFIFFKHCLKVGQDLTIGRGLPVSGEGHVQGLVTNRPARSFREYRGKPGLFAASVHIPAGQLDSYLPAEVIYFFFLR